MTTEESEREAHARATTATTATDAAGGAAEVTAAAAAAAGSGETVAGAATPETLAGAATPATIHPADAPAAEATSNALTTIATPSPPPPAEVGARVGHSLETIKTAVVWLVVIQILTILSPLLRVSLKWSLIVGAILTLSSFAVAAVAYLKAQRAQRSLPE